MPVRAVKMLVEWRAAAGLTQAEAADRLDCPPALVSHWENGRRKPSVESLGSLARVYALQAAEIASYVRACAPPPPGSETADLMAENEQLRAQVGRLERQLESVPVEFEDDPDQDR